MTPPDWLVALQADFGRMLRTPLDVSSGTFAARPEAADPVRAGVRAALSVSGVTLYQEQYAMRLFAAAQDGWPRLVRAIGPWAFNQLVAEHLVASPPRSHDLADVADGIDVLALRRLDDGAAAWPVEPGLVQEAIALDRAERDAFVAPWRPWAPAAEDLADLERRVLPLSPGTTVLRASYDLVAWPSQPVGAPAAKLDRAQWWVVSRTPDGTASRRVDAIAAALLRGARRRPLGEALVRLTADLGPEQHAALAERLPRYVRAAVANGWWAAPRPIP